MCAGNGRCTAHQVGVDKVSLRGLLLYCVHKLTFYELKKWNVDMKKINGSVCTPTLWRNEFWQCTSQVSTHRVLTQHTLLLKLEKIGRGAACDFYTPPATNKSAHFGWALLILNYTSITRSRKYFQLLETSCCLKTVEDSSWNRIIFRKDQVAEAQVPKYNNS